MKLSKEYIKTFCGDVVTLKVENAENENVVWCTDDTDAIFIRDFKEAKPDSFSDRVLLVLKKEGVFNVFAQVNGEKCSCRVEVRKMQGYKKGDKLNFYFADLHNHTSCDHNFETFPYREQNLPCDCIEYVRKDGFLDCIALSDHGEISNNADFFRTMETSENYTDEKLIVFGGMESEVSLIEEDRYGRKCKNSGEAVTFNCDNYAAVENWEDFFVKMDKSDMSIGTFAHPQVLGFGECGIWDFKFGKNANERMKNFFRLIEMGNGTEKATNMLHEYAYSTALDYGFRLSPTSSSDSHGPVWGKEATIGKTVIMAPCKSKEMFVDSVRHNRVYATESGNVKLEFSVNGYEMGETIPPCSEYKFKIKASAFDENIETAITKLEVISDFGEVIYREEGNIKSSEFIVNSISARYFYIKLCDEEGYRTWSSPVWTGRDAEVYEDDKLININNMFDRAVDLKTGKDAEKLINGDIYDLWEGKGTNAEIEITLSEQCEISAIGIYPYQFTTEDCNKISPGNINPVVAVKAAAFAREYEIYTAGENKSYEKAAEGKIRIYGEEAIIKLWKKKVKYIKVKFLSTAGSVYEKKGYDRENIRVGTINIYKIAR